MIKLRKARATKYDSDSKHREYGIYNFLKLKGFTAKNHIIVIDAFLKEYDFKAREDVKPDQIKGKKISFVHNRFAQFASFVNKQFLELDKEL